MKRTKKQPLTHQLLSCVLALVLTVGLMPTTAFAAHEEGGQVQAEAVEQAQRVTDGQVDPESASPALSESAGQGQEPAYEEDPVADANQQQQAQAPAITNDLDDENLISYKVGDEAAPLEVETISSDGGTLSYQWYKADSAEALEALNEALEADANAQIERIKGLWKLDQEEDAKYTPPTDAPGTAYYFVVATNTLGQTSARTISEVATVAVAEQAEAQAAEADAAAAMQQDVAAAKTAEAPSPKTPVWDKAAPSLTKYEYDIQGTPEPISVHASVDDGGTVIYRWYSNDAKKAATNAKKAICANPSLEESSGYVLVKEASGTEGESYTPDTSVAGQYHFFVVAVNEIDGVRGAMGIASPKISSGYYRVDVVDYVANAMSKIDAIGDVTLSSMPKITSAEKAYGKVPPEKQALVTNHDVLVQARARYDYLVAEKNRQDDDVALAALSAALDAAAVYDAASPASVNDHLNAMFAARQSLDKLAVNESRYTEEQKQLFASLSSRIEAMEQEAKDLHLVKTAMHLEQPRSKSQTLPNDDAIIYSGKIANDSVPSYSETALYGYGYAQQQWYRCDDENYSNPVPIGEAGELRAQISGSYASGAKECPAGYSTVIGKNYYFYEVTIEGNGTRSSSRSDVVYIETLAPSTDAFGIILGEESVGRVEVSIKDTTAKRDDLVNGMGEPIEDPGPVGNFITGIYVPIYPSDTMMTIIARACLKKNCIQEGAAEGYIRRIADNEDSRAEFDRGASSGWMGTLNGWYTDQGFDAYTVANGSVFDGSKIELRYTVALGKDVSAYGKNGDLSLSSLSNFYCMGQTGIGTSADNAVYPSLPTSARFFYAPGTEKHKGVDTVRVMAEQTNHSYPLHIYHDGVEYLSGSYIPFKTGDTVEIVVGDRATDEYAVYTLALTNGMEASLLAEGVTFETLSRSGASIEQAKVVPTDSKLSFSTRNGFASAPEVNEETVSMTLPNLPIGASAVLHTEDGAIPAIGNRVVVDGAIADPAPTGGVWNWCLVVTLGDLTEYYPVQITKTETAFTALDMVPYPAYGAIFQGQPEGTYFQLDADGNETGATGFSPTVFDYNVYVSNATNHLRARDDVSSVAGNARMNKEVWVNGARATPESTYSTNESNKQLSKRLYDDPIALGASENSDVRFVSYDTDRTTGVAYTLHVKRTVVTAEDIIAAIDALPPVEGYSYSRDAVVLSSARTLYEQADDAVQAAVPADRLAKLEALAAEHARQEVAGKQAIEAAHAAITAYPASAALGQGEAAYKNELRTTYREAVISSYRLYASLSGWVLDEFNARYPSDAAVAQRCYNIVMQGTIADGSSTGTAVSYPDDFVGPRQAITLSLDTYAANPDAYRVTYIDYIMSYNKEGGGNSVEGAVPWNTPGHLKFTIADPEIFEIRTVQSTYTDQGLGGGATYPDERYYFVPKKAGTTTFTLTRVDDKGAFLGQEPEVIVHVNSAAEDAIPDLRTKLCTIATTPYTTNYDTWYYWEGEAGAPFSFTIAGTDPEVRVKDYRADSWTSYDPDADGNVTILLKDGYNPIEVTSTFEGQRVTQVYGLRGKAARYTVSNISRPGQDPRQGDEVNITLEGIEPPVRKVLRIYNPSAIHLNYDTDQPGQSTIEGAAGQYSSGSLRVTLTGSGKVTLVNGRISTQWWGSGLGSEGTQGNTGGIAGQDLKMFSRLPDITLDVAPAPEYAPSYRVHPVIEGGDEVKAGQEVTITLPEIDTDGLTARAKAMGSEYYLSKATTVFATDIPGLPEATSALCGGSNSSLDMLKKVKLTVPEDVEPGTYRIYGGYISAMANWPSHQEKAFRYHVMEIADVELTVVAEDDPVVPDDPTGDVAYVPLPAPESTVGMVTENASLEAAASGAQGYLSQNASNPQVGSTGGEWAVIGLLRGDAAPEGYADQYYANLLETLKRQGGILHDANSAIPKYTEYSRVVLALTAAGFDPSNVGGYDLLAPLADYQSVCAQGINGPIWALIALDAGGYDVPKAPMGVEQNTRTRMIEAILGRQLDDGGWALSASSKASDVDMTAMALQSLAPYATRSGEEATALSAKVDAAIQRALTWLSSVQAADGTFGSTDGACAESGAQVIVALTRLGIDPHTDARFVKAGGSVVDGLLAYAVPGGGFGHTSADAVNGMATEQAAYALVAYDRFRTGKPGLYDMYDAKKDVPAPVDPVIPEEPIMPEAPAKPQPPATQVPNAGGAHATGATRGLGGVTRTLGGAALGLAALTGSDELMQAEAVAEAEQVATGRLIGDEETPLSSGEAQDAGMWWLWILLIVAGAGTFAGSYVGMRRNRAGEKG